MSNNNSSIAEQKGLFQFVITKNVESKAIVA
jgi:hypothetical protein